MIVMTKSIRDTMSESTEFTKELVTAIKKYYRQDWGDMCEEDKELNDNAYKYKNDRILAAYNTSEGKIYIITESDRSTTTILFSDEY